MSFSTALIKKVKSLYSIRNMDEFDGTSGFMWVDCDDRSSEVFQDYDSALDDAINDYVAIMTEYSYFK